MDLSEHLRRIDAAVIKYQEKETAVKTEREQFANGYHVRRAVQAVIDCACGGYYTNPEDDYAVRFWQETAPKPGTLLRCDTLRAGDHDAPHTRRERLSAARRRRMRKGSVCR